MKDQIRVAVLAATVVLAVGCSSSPPPTPAPTVWGERVPEAAPEVIAAQPVVARGPDSITLLPISPTGAVVGTVYAYDMPHCGTDSPIDIDGSFWDAFGVPPANIDGRPGTWRLLSPTEAIVIEADGEILRLVRHSGARKFRYCD